MKTITMTTCQLRSFLSAISKKRIRIKDLKNALLVSLTFFVAFPCLQVSAASGEPESCFLSGSPFVNNEILGLDEAISGMLASSDPLVVAEGRHLRSLAFDLHPTLFIRNGVLSNPGGGTPECIDMDASSIPAIYGSDPQYTGVELITVRIQQAGDLAGVVNLANLQGFTSLKYICFLCTFQICSPPGCEAANISQMVQGSENSPVVILYKISIAY